jgi:hypothetical protein
MNDSNLNAGWNDPAVTQAVARSYAERHGLTLLGDALNPSEAVESALRAFYRHVMPIGPGPEANALRALYILKGGV